jgi:hypothetical protein
MWGGTCETWGGTQRVITMWGEMWNVGRYSEGDHTVLTRVEWDVLECAGMCWDVLG